MSNFRFWRLAVDSIQSPALLVTGIEYFKVSATAGGASIFTSGTPSASSEYNATFAAARAFDDDTTYWSNSPGAGSIPAHVQYDRGAGNATVGAFLELRAYPPNHGYSPKLLRLLGSNDGATWADLLSVDILGYTLSNQYVIDSLGTLRIPFSGAEPPPPPPPYAPDSKGVSLIIHTSPIRQIGANTAFDPAQPRHKTQVSTGPLRSTIGGENDNITVSFAAGDQLQTAMLSANGKRIQVFNDGEIEFDGTINSVRFDVGFVQISGAA